MAILHLGANRILGSSTTGATDTMGSTADGTAISDPTFVTASGSNGVAMPSGFGSGAKSMYFDGNDAININGAEPFSTTVGTISFWYYNTGTEESKTILCFGDTNANTFMTFETRESGDDKIVCANFESGSENWEIRNAGSLSTSAWHHCVASQNGTTVVLYIDGVELTSWNNQTDKSKWMMSALDNGRIGCRNNNSSGDAGFITGNITEVALWNVALTEAQVQSLYGNGGSTAKKADTIPTGLRAYYDGSSLTNKAVIVSEKDTLVTAENTIMNTLTYSGTTNFIHIGDSYKTRGVKINAGDSALIGYTVSSVTVRIKDYDGNGLTGNLTCSILDSSGDAVSGDSFPAYNTAGLTSTEADITFTNSNPTTTLADNYSIALQYTGDSSHRVGFERTDGADAFDGTKVCRAYRTGTSGSLGIEDSEDQILKINSQELGSDLEENTIFIEKDTYTRHWLQDSKWYPLPVRGVFEYQDELEYINVAVASNATVFGGTNIGNTDGSATGGNATYGACCGINSSDVSISRWSFATTGTGVNWGDLATARKDTTGCSNDTRFVIGGGYISGAYSGCDMVTIDSSGTASAFGTIYTNYGGASFSSATRAVFGGGYNGSYDGLATQHFMTFASGGTASSSGSLIGTDRWLSAGASNSTHGIYGGGYNGATTMQKMTIASLGTGTSFGNLSVGRHNLGALSSDSRAIWGAGGGSNVMDFKTFDNDGTCTDFGDLSFSGTCSGISDFVRT